MATKFKTTQAQRDQILALLIKNQYMQANGAALILGFTEGVTAEFFEHVISQDGLHHEVITAIAVYYYTDVKVALAASGVLVL